MQAEEQAELNTQADRYAIRTDRKEVQEKPSAATAQKKKKRKQLPVYEHAERLSVLAERLPSWYRENKRMLPWRDTGNPYDVWLSEIMLQQTRVEAVKSYFLRFREALPGIQSLADCPEERLLKLWEGLGYYSRVRNLQRAARELVEQYGGKLPCRKEALLKLPGIGSYTAGAIASIAYGQRETAVDGNVLRVAARVCGNGQDIALPETKQALEQALMRYLPEKDCGTFNQALMELGAIVCVPNGEPLCGRCPVREQCAAFREGMTGQLPVKSAKKPRRIEPHTVFLLQNGDRFLIQKRPGKGLLAGLWELPSAPGHLTETEALQFVRAAGYEPLHMEALPAAKHIFTHVEWQMTAYRLRLPADDRPRMLNAFAERAGLKETQFVFAAAEELRSVYALPSAFSAYLDLIR